MRYIFVCLSSLAAGLVPLLPALAQPDLSSRGGMALDRAPIVLERQTGVPRPIPTEPPLADPRATLPSASLMDLRSRDSVPAVRRRRAEPQPLPEEPRPR